MEFLSKLEEIRKPFYRNITDATVNHSSQLREEELSGLMSKQLLLCSQEDPFLVAFFYNKHYDILEYLAFLREMEITNISYNVLKKYLKTKGRDVIDAITATRPGEDIINSLSMRIMRGELYRMAGYPLDDCKVILTQADGTVQTISDKYAFIGYTTLLGKYLDNFPENFSKFVADFPEIIETLNFLDQRVQSAVRHTQSSIFTYLISNIPTDKYFEILDIASLTEDQIAACLRKPFSGLGRGEWIRRAATLVCRAHSADSLDHTAFSKVIRVFINISQAHTLYNETHSIFLSYISFHAAFWNVPEISSLIQTVMYIIFYHGSSDSTFAFNSYLMTFLGSLNISSDAFTRVSLPEPGTVQIMPLIEQVVGQHTSNPSFSRCVELYYIFTVSKWDAVPAVSDILFLPDKFISIALTRIGTPTSKLILEFHSNLHSMRLREKITTILIKTDRQVLARYLIARHIYQDNMDLSDFTEYMDDQYKILYAENNTEWAINNLEELKRIGPSHRLCSALRRAGCEIQPKSSFKDRQPLPAMPKVSEIAIAAQPDILPPVPHLDTRKRVRVPERMCNSENECNTTLGDEACRPDSLEQYALRSTAAKPVMAIYEELRSLAGLPTELDSAPYSKCLETFLESINTYEEYKIAITTLFEWLKGTSSSLCLAVFIALTVPKYDFLPSYLDFEEILQWYASSKAYPQLLKAISSVISLNEVKQLIDSLKDESSITLIIEGVGSRVNRMCPENPGLTSDMKELATELLSDDMTKRHIRVLAGIEMFRILPDGTKPDVSLIMPLLSSSNDKILVSAIAVLPPGDYNEQLLPIIFKRNKLDDLTANIIKRIDIRLIVPDDLARIYSIFYAAPLLYIKHALHYSGLAINESMAIELIGLLSEMFDEALFSKISMAFNAEHTSQFKFTHNCYHTMITRLNTPNRLFTIWVFEHLDGLRLSTAWFIKICWIVGNEVDAAIIKKGIHLLMEGMPDEKDLILKMVVQWKKNYKLRKLLWRVYPLMKALGEFDMDAYKEWIRDCDEDELHMLKDIYDVIE